MVNPLTYATYTTEVAQLTVVDPNDVNFQSNLPSAIDYAELRIYQDLDLLSTVTPTLGFSTATGIRSLTWPLSQFITMQEVNIILPVGVSDPTVGTRSPVTPTAKEVLDFMWPSASGSGVPNRFAMVNQNTIYFGPWPDNVYAVELVGTVRPPSLSATNTTTFISSYLPSLMLMATMIFISGYQRNFGKQSDDPQMAVSYESQYQTLKSIALAEEARKKFQASAWTSMSAPVAATPTR